ARFWKGWAEDSKTCKAGEVRVGCGWLLGSQFITVTAAGRNLTNRVGQGGIAKALQEILDAYAKLPEADRRPESVSGEGKPMPAPPPGGVVLTVYDRPLVREADGSYRHAKGKPDGLSLTAPAGQRTTLWLTADECASLIPANPAKGATHDVPT